MNTQVPPGSENAVSTQEYPQFAAGHAQYPPADYPPARAHDARLPVSAPPAGYPIGGVPAGEYPPVSYPQEGAAGYPVPVPYPQPSVYPPPPAYSTAPPWAAAWPASLIAEATTTPPANHDAEPTTSRSANHGAEPASAWPANHGTAPTSRPANHDTAPATTRLTNHGTAPTATRGLPAEPPPQYGGLLVPFPDAMRHASRAQAPAVWPVAAFTLLFSVLGAVSAKRRADQARRTRNSTAPYWIAFLISAAAGAFCWFVFAAVVVVPLLSEVRETSRLEAVQRNVVGDGQLRTARITVTAAQCRAVNDRDAEGMRDYLCRLTLEGGRIGTLALTADESGQWHAEPAR